MTIPTKPPARDPEIVREEIAEICGYLAEHADITARCAFVGADELMIMSAQHVRRYALVLDRLALEAHRIRVARVEKEFP